MRALITAATVAAAAAFVVVPSPAQAAARVTVTNDQGSSKADPTYATTLKVKGTGFQSIKGGHGGIYVFFGSVSGQWRPTKGGQTGRNMFYVPDSEAKNNQGFQRFVTFPGNEQTGGSANGGEISASGKWSTSVTVPGASFQAVDRAGKARTIDCLKVQCGVITIGAHGVKNSNNETFTPVAFADLYEGKAPATAKGTAAAPGATATPAEAGAASVAPAPKKSVKPAAKIDPSTAVAGRVLSFTGVGFSPGEQVIASLDDGIAAVGPLGAGPSGEIAGVMQLPAELSAGTHVLRLTGAGSGVTPIINFPVAAAPAEPTAAATDKTDDRAAYAFVAVATLILIASCVFAFARIKRGRHERAASHA